MYSNVKNIGDIKHFNITELKYISYIELKIVK